MLDHEEPTEASAAQPADEPTSEPQKRATKKAAKKTTKKATAKKSADKSGAKAATKSTATKTAASKSTSARRTKMSAAVDTATTPDSDTETAPGTTETTAAATKKTRKTSSSKRSTTKAAAESDGGDPTLFAADPHPADESPAEPAPRKRATRKSAAAKSATAQPAATEPELSASEGATPAAPVMAVPLFQAPTVTVTTRSRRATSRASQDVASEPATEAPQPEAAGDSQTDQDEAAPSRGSRTRGARKRPSAPAAPTSDTEDETESEDPTADDSDVVEADLESSQDSDDADDSGDSEGQPRRRRRRGGRRRRRSSDDGDSMNSGNDTADAESDADDDAEGEDGLDGEGSEETEGSSSSRRRRRRRRAGDHDSSTEDDPENTVTRVRSRRSAEDQITAVTGSTRLEAKKQRRREGREAGRRRAPIVSEAEFLARRESVERVMAIRQRKELTQIAVLEDKVLVEHYVARESQTSLIGNVYLGRVQNVLPSMEAAFIDIGKGRNAVLYAGEVNWQALGHKEGQPRKIESVLSSGQTVLVQVTKDPVGHKGARLTSQVSLAGRFLVYVPDGNTSGISRKLPDTERTRLKTLLKEIVPDTAGVIVRTAAEGASEEELTSDVERLKSRWEEIERKAKGNAPQLLYGEPDLTLKVVRDLFTEDFTKLIIDGDEAWQTVQGYVTQVAPDLEPRLERFEAGPDGKDVFGRLRIEEQINKGLDRKVWLPSGGSLIIDRTEAMTVVDVNTGKFTGSGGNLEETVTKNNLEAAEEIVRQLRLRDIGGIIVIDFIDMVLESNRDLVVRRLVECLGRDRTRHQVAEVTSLGLVQMTRKRIGTGLLESFSTDCQACSGRGVVVHNAPIEPRHNHGGGEDDSRRSNRRTRGGRRNDNSGDDRNQSAPASQPTSDSQPAEPATGEQSTEQAQPNQAEPNQAQPDGNETPPAGGQGQPDDSQPGQGNAQPLARSRSSRGRGRGRRNGEAAQDSADQNSADQEAAPTTEPEAVTSPSSDTAAASDSPSEAQAPQAAPVDVASEPTAPTVVTRTRGRSARRPAGPPPEVEPDREAIAAQQAMADAATNAEQPAPAPPVVTHVPIKKKGSRAR